LVAPDGPPLSVSGTIVQSRALGVGGSEVVMVFDVEQPRRSRIRAVA
jgi:hypothetical protein